MPLPKISLVTCSYQQGKFIDATIRSVLDQGYENLEYIVIDGGSRDQTVEVIKKHEHRLAHWVSEKDRGQTHALEKGFAQASGEIFGWLCSDDLLLPGALEAVGRYFQAHPEVDMVYGDALWIDAAGQFLRPKKEMPWDSFVMLFGFNFISQPACFWRRSLHEKAGGLDERLHLTMDFDLWLRFSRHTKPVYLPTYLACMRDYPEQKTRSLRDDGMKEWFDLIRRESPTLAKLPYALLHGLALLSRFARKGINGGYSAKVPADTVSSLANYRIG